MTRRAHNLLRSLVLIIIIGTISVTGYLAYTCYQGFISSESKHFDLFSNNIFSGTSKQSIHYQSFITPDSPAVILMASKIKSNEEAYNIANDWIYVSERTLSGIDDNWLLPEEFLTDSPYYKNNPIPGEIVGDCEEQANTLTSLLRAHGVPPEEVRVVLGIVSSGETNKGHVWVELYQNNSWLALDPSQGPRWNDNTKLLSIRPGLDFYHYSRHIYPVPEITAYYNDKYFVEPGCKSSDIPELWEIDFRKNQWLLLK